MMAFLNNSNKPASSVFYTVEKIDTKRNEKRPPPPYTTSSIQQDLGSRLGLPAKMLMSILQKLYESGMITYHRTDSTNLSSYAVDEIKKYVTENIGENYVHTRAYKTKAKCAQEAHEAIRPTYFRPELPDGFTDMENKVYSFIFKRTVASQMKAYVYDLITVTIGISNSELKYIASAEKPIFDGYRRIYDENVKDKDDDTNNNDGESSGSNVSKIENISVGDVLPVTKIVSTEKYKTPPVRYSEATLIKKMEVLGIGRPSTYANILETLLERNYVEKKDIQGKKVDTNEYTLVPPIRDAKDAKEIKRKVSKTSIGAEKKKMVPTEIGKITMEFLEKNFKDIVNYDFTNQMENRLDVVASGAQEWTNVIGDFYSLFHPNVELLKAVPSMKAENENKRMLGTHEGKNIYTYVAKYGPVIQIGEDKDKKYVKLDDKFNVKTVTLDDVLGMIKYPLILGTHNGHDVIVKKGPYGFYINYNEKNYKMPVDTIVDTLTLDDAINKCINPSLTTITTISALASASASSSREGSETGSVEGAISEVTPNVNISIKSVGDYHIKIGKYGPYILFKGKFYKIYGETNPEVLCKMTKEECKKVVDGKKTTDTKKTTKK